ncbi:MAG: type II-A CRISPR-associated protein Csn2 [Atopobiaceae bacterium]|nr:type II-A CRISPR-associated protein Csn2 [Atopobiaceae bacterium]
MRLRFIRLDCDVLIAKGKVSTLEVHNEHVFARMVRALISASGKYAMEPYLLLDANDKAIRPQSAIVVNSLPSLPLQDRNLVARLYKRVVQLMESDATKYTRLHELAAQLENEVSQIAEGLWGDYGLASDWNLEAYLKAFKFSSSGLGEDSLLDNCIKFFDLCVDVAPDSLVILVNSKSFFTQEELAILFDHAVFCGVDLLLIESWPCDTVYELECKTVLDQHFLVM